MNKISIDAINTRSGVISISWIVVQQIIVASSVFFVSKAISFVSADYESSLFYLSLFCLSLVLVYVPYAMAMIYSEQWKYDAYNKFIINYTSSLRLKPESCRKKINSHQSIISSESRVAFYDTIDSIGNLISLLFNYVFSVIAVTISVDPLLLPYYLLSVIIMMTVQLKTKNSVSKYASLIQFSKNETMKRIFRVSELSSAMKFDANMHNKFRHRHERQKNLSVNLEKYTLKVNVISSFLTLSIVMAGNFHLIYNSDYSMEVISIVIVTMPRQVQIVQSSMGYLNSLFKVHQCNQKMLNIIDIIK